MVESFFSKNVPDLADDSASVAPDSLRRPENRPIRRTSGVGALARTTGAVAVGVAPDLIDSALASVSNFTPLDFERFSLTKNIPLANEHLGAVEIASGVAGLAVGAFVGPEVAGLALVDKAIKGNKALRFAFATADEAETARKALFRVDSVIARQGEQGIDALRGSANLFGANVKRPKIAGAARLAAAKKTFKDGVTTEALIAATLNENAVVVPDDATFTSVAVFAGLGIVLPAVFEQIAVGASFRRGLQATELLRSRQAALGAGSGMAELRESAFGKAASLRKDAAPRNVELAGDFDVSIPLSRSDQITVAAVELQAQRRTPVPSTTSGAILRRNRAQASEANSKEIRDLTNTLTVRGVLGSREETRFLLKDAPAEAQTLNDAIRQDPFSMFGVVSLGRIPEGEEAVTKLITAHREALESARFESELVVQLQAGKVDKKSIAAVEEAQARLVAIREQEKNLPVVFVDGEVVSATQFAKLGTKFDSKRVVTRGGGRDEATLATDSLTDVTIRMEDGALTLPLGKARFNDLTATEARSAFGLGRMFVDKLPANKVFKVGKKPAFFQLDLAEELIRRRGSAITVEFPAGMTRESAQLESFAQKVDAIRALGPGKLDFDEIPALRQKFNLPAATEIQRLEAAIEDITPLENLIFKGLKGSDVRKMSLDDLQRNLALARKREGSLLSEGTGPEVADLMGSQFSSSLGVSGFAKGPVVETAPVFAMRRPLTLNQLDASAIQMQRAEDLAQTFATLTNPNTAPASIRLVAQQVLESNELKEVINLSRLDDSTLVTSLRDQDIRQGLGALQDLAAANNPTILAAQRLFRTASFVFEKNFDDFLDTALEGSAKTIRQSLETIQIASNRESRLLVEQFAEARRGFQLTGKVRQAEDGKFEFLLKDTEANRVQYEAVTGVARLPKDATLPLSNGQPLGVNAEGLDALNALSAIANKERLDKNAILRANGLPSIGVEPFYIPPPKGEFRAFIMDGNGSTVRQITADSAQGLKNQILAQEQNPASFLNKNKDKGFLIKSESELQQSASMLSRAEVEFLDPGNPFVQSIKGSTRTGAGASPFAVGRNVSQIVQQFKTRSQDTARELMETIFRPQLTEAHARVGIAVSRNQRSRGTGLGAAGQPIEELFINTLTGRQRATGASSNTGTFLRTIDNALQLGLNRAHSVFVHVGGRKVEEAFIKQGFEEAVAKLGTRTPFETATELLAEKNLFKTPPAIGAFAQKFNSLATHLMLRYDTGHAVTTLAGVAATMPGVAAALRVRPGETLANVAGRLGRSADVFADSSQGVVATTWSVEKEMAGAIHDMFTAEGQEIMQRGARFGYLDAAISEMHRDLGRIKDASTFSKVMQGADKTLGFLSDNAEQFAVNWSYMTAQRLLKRMGVEDVAIRDNMARQFVDQAIGNFSPLNRPQIFQSGGLGTTMGLFQTFTFNYYGRLFGYIENRQHRALAVQAAVQAQWFGLNSVPGVTQYRDFVFGLSRGENDPTADLYNKLDYRIADALFYGTPATVGLIFGLSRDSIPDLTSRGNVDPRVPSITNLPPGLSVARTIFEGLGAGFNLGRRDNPGVTSQQWGELLQRHVANRPLSAAISMFWTDALVDRSGNLVAEETRTALGALVRLSGLRTVQQSMQQAANSRFRASEAMRRERITTLGAGLKAAVRGGEINEKLLLRSYEQFLNTGGTPDEFGSFLKRTFKAGLQTEAFRALESLLGNPDKIESRTDDIMKLFFALRTSQAFNNAEASDAEEESPSQ